MGLGGVGGRRSKLGGGSVNRERSGVDAKVVRAVETLVEMAAQSGSAEAVRSEKAKTALR